VPHVAAAWALQVEPEQQPVGHAQPLQTPAWQLAPWRHAAHACPALPHAPVAVPSSQVAPLQQPLHDRASHTHWPAAQRWPEPQAGCDPHWQSPFASQPSLEAGEQPAHAHFPLTHCLPGGHWGPPPQVAPSWL
jgi:hypothetical protein